MFETSNSHWLTPGEQDDVLTHLLQFGLLKHDNKRKLPLKMGGTTDVYVNLRDCRSRPGATNFLAECFENPLRRMRTQRLIEMPSALSGVAGVLAERLGIPYVTIRDSAKAGRVSDAEIIGQLVSGQRTTMFDDVMTNGDTKIPAHAVCLKHGVAPQGLVVLVDRQQGWQNTFIKAGISIPVWSGMTLHDVRKFLIRNGLMQRCDTTTESTNPIILALDGKNWNDILPIIDRLRPTGCILKVNDLLTTDNINSIVTNLGVYGRVMVDPKWHDIPNTITNYCERLRWTPPWALTVHASGGEEMLNAAVKIFAGTPTMILAVTVLTSLKEGCKEIYGRQPLRQVLRLASIAWKAGVRGFVCSGEEVAHLRAAFPEAVIVVPGLRSPGSDVDDQKRVVTFADAMAAGANYYVGGRQFLTVNDPVAEIERVKHTELGVPKPAS